MVSKRIARQLYFALIHSRIQYGMETYGTCAKDALDSTCNQVEHFTSIHYMLKTKYELSLRPKLIVSYLPHKVLLPNFPLRYSTGGRVRLSVDAGDTTSESLGGAHWHPSVGGVLWPSLVVVSHECVPAAIYAPMGPFSWLMVVGLAGVVCACWRVAWNTPDGSWNPWVQSAAPADSHSWPLFWLPARLAFGFSGDHQQNIQCLTINRCYVLVHVWCS